MNSKWLRTIGLVAFISTCGCGSRPDVISVVVSDMHGSKLELSQKQARWFVGDITGPGRRSEISKYPAIPIATFEYGGRKYLMHGNAVIHVDANGTEYFWTGPYLQALISADFEISSAIAALEKMDDLSAVKMDAPGAYPGGGAAPLVHEP